MNPYNPTVYGFFGYIDKKYWKPRSSYVSQRRTMSKEDFERTDRERYLLSRVRCGAIPLNFTSPEENNWYYDEYKKLYGDPKVDNEIFIVRCKNERHGAGIRTLCRLDCNKINNARFIKSSLVPSDIRRYNTERDCNEVIGYKEIPIQIFATNKQRRTLKDKIRYRKYMLINKFTKMIVDDKIIKKSLNLDALLLDKKTCKKKNNDYLDLAV